MVDRQSKYSTVLRRMSVNAIIVILTLFPIKLYFLRGKK